MGNQEKIKMMINWKKLLKIRLYDVCYEFCELHDKDLQRKLCELVIEQIMNNTSRQLKIVDIKSQKDEDNLVKICQESGFSHIAMSNVHQQLSCYSEDVALIDFDESEVILIDCFVDVIDHLYDFYDNSFDFIADEDKDEIIYWILNNYVV